jgi:hypothetical protein
VNYSWSNDSLFGSKPNSLFDAGQSAYFAISIG